jgi:hypothetical protein
VFVELVEIFANNIFPILLLAAIGFAIGRHFGIEPDPVSADLYVFTRRWCLQTLHQRHRRRVPVAVHADHRVHIIMIFAACSPAPSECRVAHRRANVIIAAFASTRELRPVAGELRFGDAVLSCAVVVYIANITSTTAGGLHRLDGRVGSGGCQRLKTPALYALVAAFSARVCASSAVVPGSLYQMLPDATIPDADARFALGQFRMAK